VGGVSLVAARAVSRLRSPFGVGVPVKPRFETGTVAGLTEHIEKARRQAALQQQAPPLVPVGRDTDLPLSFAQQRLWFFDQLEPGNLFYNLPNAIRLSGTLDVAALRKALEEITRRHEGLRTTFATRDGQPVQVIAPTAALQLPVTDISGLPESEREAGARELATQETREPFDLAKGPLVRVSLVRLGAEEHVLLLTMHHIISDGWSMCGIFFRVLSLLYLAYAA